MLTEPTHPPHPNLRAHAILEPHRVDLEVLLREKLRHSTAVHYRSADADLLDPRLHALVDAFLAALHDHPVHFGQYLRQIAGERFDEGVDLTEIQFVLNLLGERTWALLCAEIDEREALIDALGRTSSVIGHAKDTLAQVYLERSRRDSSTLVRLRSCLDQLTKGTDSAPIDD